MSGANYEREKYMTSLERYLPTNKFHILPIRGITPDELKRTAKDCLRDRENIGHSTLLNLMAKQLGFKQGFAGFKAEYDSSLVGFMKDNGLKHRADLLAPRLLPQVGMPRLKLSIEQLSDRFFNADKPLPSAVFTGYDFDYKRRFDDVLWDFNQSALSAGGRPILGNEACIKLLEDVSEQPVLELEKGGRTLVDLVLGGFLFDCIEPAFNLMGGLLLSDSDSDLMVSERYWNGDYNPVEKRNSEIAVDLAGQLFRREIAIEHFGWVDVIPYNDKLIFLRGRNGEYDFVIKGVRSSSFNHQIYSPYLRRSDVPAQMNEEYHFQRWYYFEYQGWREWDEHCSEQSYYAGGGNTQSYPGLWSIRRMYFIKLGVFKPICARSSAMQKLPFAVHRVQLDSKSLYVSDLITIADLMLFSNQNPRYFEARVKYEDKGGLDRLSGMNSDSPNLPAATTWFDACAYMAHIERAYNIPVRLLKAGEYQTIRQQCGDDYNSSGMMDNGSINIHNKEDIDRAVAFPFKSDGLLEFSNSSGKSFGSYSPHMNVDDFQNLNCRFTRILEYSRHPSGLKFVDSDSFCEWLYENPYGREAACVRSKSISSVYGAPILERDMFPANSTGKYKNIKVGFRICFAAS
jgi:hypothetical protein